MAQPSYWSPRFPAARDAMSYDEAVTGAREKLIRAVDHCLRADVPVAFCLSGGIDSNALAGVARRVLGYDVHGFTIMNTDARYEERELVETSVRELELRHTPVPLETEEFLPRLRELVRQHDAPIYTITYYAQWRLMQRAWGRPATWVSISGTGAGELFSGYFDHHNAYLAAMASEAPARPCRGVARVAGVRGTDRAQSVPEGSGSVCAAAVLPRSHLFGCRCVLRHARRSVPRAFRGSVLCGRPLLRQPHWPMSCCMRVCLSSSTRTISTRCTTRSRTVRRSSIAICSNLPIRFRPVI